MSLPRGDPPQGGGDDRNQDGRCRDRHFGTVVDRLFDLKRAVEAPLGVSLAAFSGDIGVGRGQTVDDAAKGEYVCAEVHVAA